MEDNRLRTFVKQVIENTPDDWLHLTTHRLDIYEEKLAKSQFLEQFEELYVTQNTHSSALEALPTAYDYIRLGHPLSCVLEWGLAKLNGRKPEQVISFSSQVTPILAILRKNLLANKNTQICHIGELPSCFDADLIRWVYGYRFELRQVDHPSAIGSFDGSTVCISTHSLVAPIEHSETIDFHIHLYKNLGSVIMVNGAQNDSYIAEIQHVRRRETIAARPSNLSFRPIAMAAPTTRRVGWLLA